MNNAERKARLKAARPTPGLYWLNENGQWTVVQVDDDGWVWGIGSEIQVGDANCPFDWSRLGPAATPPL
jgi:hypothetical protein